MSTLTVGDANAIIELTIVRENGIARNLVGATTLEFEFLKPGGDVVVKDVEFTSDGRDGRLRYVTEADDLDESGEWSVRAHVVNGDFDRRSLYVPFSVAP